MKSRVNLLALLLLLGFTSASDAQIRYEAGIASDPNKLWEHSGNKLSCELNFAINDYGIAKFTTHSGLELKTNLVLKPDVVINSMSKMDVLSTTPAWKSKAKAKVLGELTLYKGYEPFMGDTLSRIILQELAIGRQVLFPYTDPSIIKDQTIVPVISPLGFKEHYKEYIKCTKELLRVGFEDERMLALLFRVKESKLTFKSEKDLQQQIEYIKADPSIIKIQIRAYAYDMEQNIANDDMAKERAEFLKKSYLDAGIDESLIEIIPFSSNLLKNQEAEIINAEALSSRNALIILERNLELVDDVVDSQVPDVGAL